MEFETMLSYLNQYGMIAVFIVVFLEYLNLPGFPAGVIMPLAGIWSASQQKGFLTAMFVTTAAGLLGSLLLYLLGRIGGSNLLEKYERKFPQQKEAIGKLTNMLERKGIFCIFIGKLIPMARTLISIPAGVLKMPLGRYVVSSLAGVAIWNAVFVGAGYFMGDRILPFLMR